MAAQRASTVPAEEVVGMSAPMERLRRQIAQVACSDVTLLLQGESGTGKELLARMAHRLSARSGRPFLAINCAAISETLAESQLFGHEAGAYTDARKSGLGFFRSGEGGTLLLDEVGEMSERLQRKLLRVLAERTLIPVGGTKAIPIDVRIIAATNRDLAEDVETGAFRRDLYYRLNVVRLSIPPLRERRGDIPELTQHMLRKVADLLDAPVKRLSREARALLMRYDWPGNVRELGNVIQHAYVLGQGSVIEPTDLAEELQQQSLPCRPVSAEGFVTLDQAMRLHVSNALELSDGVRTRAAQMLGVSRRSLYRMLDRFRMV